MDIIETTLEIFTFDFWIFGMEISVVKWNHCLPASSLISYIPGGKGSKNYPLYLKAWVLCF